MTTTNEQLIAERDQALKDAAYWRDAYIEACDITWPARELMAGRIGVEDLFETIRAVDGKGEANA